MQKLASLKNQNYIKMYQITLPQISKDHQVCYSDFYQISGLELCANSFAQYFSNSNSSSPIVEMGETHTRSVN